MRFSSLAGSSRQYSHNLRECWVPFPLLFSDSSFPSLRYFPYVHAVINILLNSWGGLCRCLEFSVYSAFSFPVFWSANSRCLSLSWLSASPQLRESAMFHLGYSLLCCSLETYQGSKLRQLRSSPFLKGHCSLLPDVQCFKNYCFMCFVWFFACFK